MHFGSLTEHIDTAETAVWLFFIAFAGAIYYLRKLDKREGYPMKASPLDATSLIGFPAPPAPKIYPLMEGATTVAPHHYPQPPSTARPLHRFDGTPLIAVDDPLTTPLGPGAWVMRREEPMLTEKGEPMLHPLRLLPDWSVLHGDLDLRGRPVLDRRYFVVGTVHDLWIDRSMKILRLLEVRLHDAPPGDHVLVPIFRVDVREADREVRVTSLEAHQFAGIPRPEHPDVIGAREEERINAYFAAGRFYRDADAVARHETR